MFSELEIDMVNAELQVMADEVVQAAVEMLYDEMVDGWLSEFELMEYAARSYDRDCFFYGVY